MKDCEICGNEIAVTAATCPFCGSAQRAGSVAGPRQRMRTINIEAGHPTVEEGLDRLRADLALARAAGVRVARVIHGWGSSGTGGKLRDACRALLRRELGARRLRTVIAGDDYSRGAVAARDLMRRCPELKPGERSDTGNPGITLVEL